MVYGEGVIDESMAKKWFAKFQNVNFDIDDMPRSGKSSEFDKDHLKALLKEENCQTSLELVKKMNCDQKTILNYFHSMRFAKKLGVWVLMSLAKITKKIAFKLFLNILPTIEQHTVTNSTFCTESSRRWEMVPVYKYEAKKRMGGTPRNTPKPRVKSDLHPRKTMICIW